MGLLTLRKPANETQAEKHTRSRIIKNRLHEIMEKVAHLDDIVESACVGDTADLLKIGTEIDRFVALLEQRPMRIKIARDAKLLPACNYTLDEFGRKPREIDVASVQDRWGRVFAAYLALDNQSQESEDKLLQQTTHRTDTATEEYKVPTSAGPKGFVIAKLPVVFTTDRSISASLKKFPEAYYAAPYSGGYVMQNQLIVGIDPTGLSTRTIAKKIDLVIAAYRASKGLSLVNVLENKEFTKERGSDDTDGSKDKRGKAQKIVSERLPFFWKKGNPLAFAWLMPVENYSRAPFQVRNIELNTRHYEDDKPAETNQLSVDEKLAKNKAEREEFERFLAQDKTYNDLVEEEKAAKAFSDTRAAVTLRRRMEKRRTDLLEIWRGKRNPNDKLEDAVATPKARPKTTHAARHFFKSRRSTATTREKLKRIIKSK